MEPVLKFLTVRTTADWVNRAVTDLPTILLDHAVLELKAAQQAQKLIWKYGIPPHGSRKGLAAGLRSRLLYGMSRLAREELRHFEQVLAILMDRDIEFRALTVSPYAASLHAQIRHAEPMRLVDTLIVGAIIEARSCERFLALVPQLDGLDRELAQFYKSLLKSEARHFADYLDLAQKVASESIEDRVQHFLALDAAVISKPDSQLRFHSGNATASV